MAICLRPRSLAHLFHQVAPVLRGRYGGTGFPKNERKTILGGRGCTGAEQALAAHSGCSSSPRHSGLGFLDHSQTTSPIAGSSSRAPDEIGGLGFALIEAVLFIVIVSIATGALLTLFGRNNQNSVEAMAQRQAQTIVAALLNEVRASPFTFCDPQDASFAAASAPTACASQREDLAPGGPEPGESRLGAGLRLDNVSDYQGTVIAPVSALDGITASTLPGAVARITVAPIGGANWNGIPSAEVALITVSLTANTLRGAVSASGIRTRYAPNGQIR
jgi:MSHA pilin protein MshD